MMGVLKIGLNPITDGRTVLSRGTLKTSHFTRNRRTRWPRILWDADFDMEG